MHFKCVPLLEGFATLQNQTDTINNRVHLLLCKEFPLCSYAQDYRDMLFSVFVHVFAENLTMCITCVEMFLFSDLITHMWLLRTVRFHVLGQSLLHGVNSVTHRTGELWHLWYLQEWAQKPQNWQIMYLKKTKPTHKKTEIFLLWNENIMTIINYY